MKHEDKHGRLYGEPSALARFSRRLMGLYLTLPDRDPDDLPARTSGHRDTTAARCEGR
ncbi:hypothetical protein Plo01_62430 [Planobispora longispora]|uniref:Uncharacterized protein n=2 Tax=Planobispora longispora TaxID=28887 RepID=A0A8J3RRE7_9ACTN|nr:hypothetical protein GCM10020093_011420 [Planobispora longispora]GIH79814.1 hypothetical protein Plo01_62430 [Planobispora longispora]